MKKSKIPASRGLLLALLLFAVPAIAQNPICADVTFTATGEKQFAVSGQGVSGANFSYRTTGSPATLSLTITAGNAINSTTATPVTKIAAVTTVTSGINIDMGKANGPFRHWYANLATLTGGTSPTVIVTGCFQPNSLFSSTFADTPTFATMTAGSVLFAGTGGLLSQDNANLFWNTTNASLFVGPRTGFGARAASAITPSIHNFSTLNPSGTKGTLFNVVAEDSGTSLMQGISSVYVSTHASGVKADGEAFEGDAYQSGAGTTTMLAGTGGYAEVNDGVVPNAAGLISWGAKVTGGAATSASGLYIAANQKTGGTLTNSYGILVENETTIAATENYAIKTLGGAHWFTGDVGIGGGSPSTPLEVNAGPVNVVTSNADGNLTEVFRTQISTATGTSNWRNSIYASESSTPAGSIFRFSLANSQTTQAAVLTVQGDSTVGIGTTGPNSTLHVVGGACIEGTDSGCANTAGGKLTATLYGTLTNCADVAGDAACAAAPAGAFVVDAADTATVVSTTAVTADSQIFLQVDSSLGTRLSVTCNTQDPGTFDIRVTARTAATSFTATVDTGPTTNPLCVNYFIVN